MVPSQRRIPSFGTNSTYVDQYNEIQIPSQNNPSRNNNSNTNGVIDATGPTNRFDSYYCTIHTDLASYNIFSPTNQYKVE